MSARDLITAFKKLYIEIMRSICLTRIGAAITILVLAMPLGPLLFGDASN